MILIEIRFEFMNQNNKLKVLCLSFRAPPAVRPQSILIGKMIPEWIKQGVDPVIVTYKSGSKWDINAPVYAIPQFSINKFQNKILPMRYFFRRKYYKKILSALKKITNKHKVDIIFSFANPQESNIIGAKLSKISGLPFVSHFSDPFYDNPYQHFSMFGKKRALLQEYKIIKRSNKAIFVNQQAKKIILKKYPVPWQEKGAVIPHCYDLKDYPDVQKIDSGKFIISYIGVFYPQRDPKMLFQSLQKVFQKSPQLVKKCLINLVGAVNNYAGYSEEKIKQMAGEYGLTDIIKIIPPVSYKESLKYMKESDCLVVIDADIPGSPFLPSKIIDYAGSGNIIIGITPDKSPTADFLNNLGCRAFNYNQVNELSAYLEKLISKEIQININKDFLKQYDVSATTAKLINIFREVLDK